MCLIDRSASVVMITPRTRGVGDVGEKMRAAMDDARKAVLRSENLLIERLNDLEDLIGDAKGKRRDGLQLMLEDAEEILAELQGIEEALVGHARAMDGINEDGG